MAASTLKLCTILLLTFGLNLAANASPMADTAAFTSCSSLTCPDCNNSVCTDAKGDRYRISCATDLDGLIQFSRKRHYAATFEACLESCDESAGCHGVTYTNEYLGSDCQLFGSITEYRTNNNETAATRLKSSVWP